MGGGMPYHLEKGATLRVIEQKMNGDRGHVREVLRKLRAVSEEPALPGEWVVRVLENLWTDPDLVQVRTTHSDHVLGDWFGYVKDPVTGIWSEPATSPPTTGYWIGYRGQVEPIVRTAFEWALELSLGMARGAPLSSDTSTDPPDPIELFWTCPVPWFEAWVVRRPTDQTSAPTGTDSPRGRGLVTIHFMTPSHTGANVAESPVAKATKALHDPVTGRALAHPVPSLEIDYERLGRPVDPDDVMLGPRPREDAHERRYATWVVTHQKHVNQVVAPVAVPYTTTRPSGLEAVDVPPLNVYTGTGDVVIVSPALRAGGVTHDGVVSAAEARAFGPGPGAAPATPASSDEEAGR